MNDQNLQKFGELVQKRDDLIKETKNLERQAFSLLRKSLEKSEEEGNNLE